MTPPGPERVTRDVVLDLVPPVDAVVPEPELEPVMVRNLGAEAESSSVLAVMVIEAFVGPLTTEVRAVLVVESVLLLTLGWLPEVRLDGLLGEEAETVRVRLYAGLDPEAVLASVRPAEDVGRVRM